MPLLTLLDPLPAFPSLELLITCQELQLLSKAAKIYCGTMVHQQILIICLPVPKVPVANTTHTYLGAVQSLHELIGMLLQG